MNLTDIDAAVKRVFEQRQISAFEQTEIDELRHDENQRQQEAEHAQTDPSRFLDFEAPRWGG